MSEREDVEALMGTLWPGKYDDRTRTWDWCGCVAPASEHFAPGFCPLLHILATHDEQVRAEALAPVRVPAGEVVLKGCGWCGHSAGHTTDEHVARWGLPGDAS